MEKESLDAVDQSGGALRDAAEDICEQLCAVITGDFDICVETASTDDTAQKLAMLSNFVLESARRAVETAEARAAELRDASRVARLGVWRREFAENSLDLSDDLHVMLGVDPSEYRLDLEELLARVHADDQVQVRSLFGMSVEEATATEQEFRALRPDGSVACFWTECQVELDAEARPIALRGVCQDVTERRATAERIYRLAHHDPLTGLANRRLLNERLANEVVRMRRTPSDSFAVLCLDLDGFKAVNDLHGHAAGDRLLRGVAARLNATVRESDTVARLGGDEFVILQPGQLQPEGGRALAERILAALSAPFELGTHDNEATVSASIGIAVSPSDGEDATDLLHNADTALYRVKGGGKNGLAFFRPEMDRELRERRLLEYDLRLAASRGELRLAWQPLSVAEAQGDVTGFEVLLRWHHAQRGLVTPDVFIPVAESCGAIGAIGAWVLREACSEAARWGKPLRVAVNVSPLQVQKGESFAEMVEDVLAATGLDPRRLILEVTEGVLIREPDRVLAALRRLKALGIQVALDDFGTGYSSLATLRAFPFDKIKLDKSFVSGPGVHRSAKDGEIVKAVLGLAQGLGLPVVAEGVETEDQFHMLREAGCQEVQGWLIGRPAPITQFAHLTSALSREAA